MVHDLAVGLGFVADGLPFGVVAEGLPVGGGGVTAGMLEDVDESFAFEGIVGGGPVGEAFHVVLVEEGDGVIAESAEEIVELAFVDVINAEFVDGRGGWHGVLFVRAWFIVADGPGGGGQQRDRGQGLQERAAVHHEILAEETSFQLVPPPRCRDSLVSRSWDHLSDFAVIHQVKPAAANPYLPEPRFGPVTVNC